MCSAAILSKKSDFAFNINFSEVIEEIDYRGV